MENYRTACIFFVKFVFDLFNRFLGTSGEAVEDIFKFSTMSDRLKILENTFHWRHLAPTAPDTLGMYHTMAPRLS